MAGRDTDHALRLEREREFHDAVASFLDAELMPPEPPDALSTALLASAGIEPGMQVLDLGCGSGTLSLELARRGAIVTGLDVSPGMIEIAGARARQFVPEATTTFIAAAVEDAALPERAFDAIVGSFILHHLDLPTAAPEIARLLAPGATAVFAENSDRNVILRLARNHVIGRAGVRRLGTKDEHPLRTRDVSELETHFGRVELSYPVFEFFQIFDRQVLRFRHPRASTICQALDRAAARVPSARPYSYRVVVRLAATA
jgi:ubiquinone/menaquinone biosynthesis C-methylase UbiE